MMLWTPPRRSVGSARPHGLRPHRRCHGTVASRSGAVPPRRTAGPYLPVSRTTAQDDASRPSPTPGPRAHGDHEALAAAATIATPALWVAAVAQAPAGSTRGLVLAVGWVGIASVLNWRRPGRDGS